MDRADIIRYWHAVELLQPQPAPRREKRDSLSAAYFHDVRVDHLVTPWSADSLVAQQKLPNGRKWRHTLFAHLYDSRDVTRELKQVFGSTQGYSEPQQRESALFSLKFDHAGHWLEDSLVLSSEAWFLGCLLNQRSWGQGFDEEQASLQEEAKALLGGVVSAAALRQMIAHVRAKLGIEGFFGPMETRSIRIRSTPVRPNQTVSEDDPINSFLLDDLQRVADQVEEGTCSAPLAQYLRRHDDSQRCDLEADASTATIIDRLLPEHFPVGCWPSVNGYGLVHSQQLAVNTVYAELANDTGLLGINGPPGTGKTTLLRDLIAAIVTQRADALAELPRASDAFAKDGLERANAQGVSRTCHRLDSSLFGFEIVVASSNNGAVENITRELPLRDKIGASWLPGAQYFAELGEAVSEQPAWGLISAALGSKARRQDFVRRYFYGDGTPHAPDVATASAPGEDQPNVAESHGFSDWIDSQANTPRTSEERLQAWEEAVAKYKKARAKVDEEQVSIQNMRQLVEDVRQQRQKLRQLKLALEDEQCRQAHTRSELVQLDRHALPQAQDQLAVAMKALADHQAVKPGWFASLLALWRPRRQWNAGYQNLAQTHLLAQSRFQRVERQAQQLHADCAQQQEHVENMQSTLEAESKREASVVDKARRMAEHGRANFLLNWLNAGQYESTEDVELAEPWKLDGWRKARANVFIQALKLHQTFFELEPKRVRSNLKFANALLQGKHFEGIDHEAVRSAWTTLFMLVPVLSSTFASFARSFGTLQAGDIGWLFVDEAGQATPQAAVGALWRSRRAVLVGDPQQLKPIVTVSDAVLEYLRQPFNVDSSWLPNQHSAQTLADQATRWGRVLETGERATWVGLPLLVHRRCDRPMFEMANTIAYGGKMVYGTTAPSLGKETSARLATGWIHASGPSQGNWVPAEGEALKQLLACLHADGVASEDISVITPFKAVRNQLRRLPKGIVSGTIHTMQGKESDIVILVLGGSADKPGARQWAVAEPNLLNVAVTRAKRRFYVIGDMHDWSSRPLFNQIMHWLPCQHLAVVNSTQANAANTK